jgi:hypothetical protein
MSANSTLCYNTSMQACSKCHVEKNSSDFFIRNKNTGKLHAQCKACYKLSRQANYALHYKQYRSSYLERARQRRASLRNEFRENMLLYLSDKSCKDCGESDIRVLELDHKDPSTKLFSVSQAVRLGFNWEMVEKEIEKCRILCANCHKKRTASQFSWYKS